MIRNPILYAAIILGASTLPAWAELPITTLATFTGTNGMGPNAAMTLSPDGNTLYGTTYQGGPTYGQFGGPAGGTVFSIPATGGTPTVLASFNGTNGGNPMAGLTLSGNTLYGTTLYGGASNGGTVFSVPITGGTPTVLASFDGSLGKNPYGGLTLSADGSTLYGTTQNGGAGNYGTVFSIPITGGTPTVLASFDGSNGAKPRPVLTISGNTLYGTTLCGGINFNGSANSGNGIVFSVPITGGTPTVLASFDGSNGANPGAGLTLSPDGTTLYGTTVYGAAANYGVVFSIPITGGTATVLASFSGSNGGNPFAGLTISGDGSTLFGTTAYGGDGYLASGTVFSVPITGGTPTVLATFSGTNGANPFGDLTLSADGNTLYGTTQKGGASYSGYASTGTGTVFSIPIPEPASLLLLSLAAPALLRRRRARQT
jgi:uncharacterized repeat protein (TIGR03803 family)